MSNIKTDDTSGVLKFVVLQPPQSGKPLLKGQEGFEQTVGNAY